MTKEITKAFILQEMQDKLKLREFLPATFLFDETVVPVYNIEQHLERWVSSYKVASITSAAAFFLCTVPPDQRWNLRRYDVIFMAAGAYKVSGIYVDRNNGENVYLDLTKGQTDSYHIDLINPVTLQPGDALRCLIDDYTSTADLRLYIDYMVEEIR